MRKLQVAFLLVAMLGAIHGKQALAATGPTSALYVMNYAEFNSGSSTGLDVIQGLSATSYNTNYQTDINIAVYNDVRTMGYGNTDQGGRFDLAGNPLPGGPYTNSIANSQEHDGTTDGNFNYTVNYTTGDVLEYDRNWASSNVLFNVAGNLSQAGYITMNALDGSFWISQWGGPATVNHYSHTGTLLGTFNSGVNTSVGLALDPVDGTLWMGDNSYKLYQFSQAGTPLQSLSYSFGGNGWYGMEFNTAVPEPGALVLAGIAAIIGVSTASRGRRIRQGE